MNVGDERSRSLWMDVEVAPDAKPLRRDAKADTVVIGSGIAGLSTAYELSGQGQQVIVVDRGRIGSGMTARTTAHLAANNDDGFKAMIDRRGEKLAKDFYVSQAAAISRIETIQAAESIACDFRRVDGFLFPGPQTTQSEIDEEREASEQAGMPVEDVVGLPLRGHEKTRCLRYPNQATFHPTKYLRGLAHCIAARGGKLFADTAVTGVEEDGWRRHGDDRKRQDDPRQARRRGDQFADQRSRRAALQAGAVPHLRDGADAAARQRCPTRSIGTRSIPTTMCGSSPARTPTISSSAAPITRAARRTTPRSATRRWRRGSAISCRRSAA